MKKIFAVLIMLFSFACSYSKEKIPCRGSVNKEAGGPGNKSRNVDPCLEAALNAQANAFSLEYLGHQFCANSVASGALAASEYGGCCYAFTAIRQVTVAYIQSTFVPCPSGIGVGIM